MGAGVVTVGRRPYAVGLYWENSPSGRVAQTAKEAASQPGQQADFYAIRGGGKTARVPQFGLGQASAGHKTGMPVFAACLANQQGGSWVGAFRLREGTVITVVRDDLIVPDGDQFYVNEGDARDRLLQEVGFGGLQRIFAPEAWAIPGGDSMPLSLLLDERRDIKLQSVRIPKRTLVIGGVLGVLLLGALGGGWYLQAQEEAEERARADALAKAQLAAQKLLPSQFQTQVDYPPPERKWEKHPLPMEVIEACRASLQNVSAGLQGWKLSQLRCDGTNVTLTWSRQSGYAPMPAKAAVNENGSTASMSVPLPALSPRGHQDLVDPKVVTARYLAQNWPGMINRIPDDPPPPPPPDFKGTWAPPPPPWVKRSFTLTVQELPASLSLFFGDLQGTVINSLSYTPASTVGGTWTVEGVIYENRS
ncbi:MAG: type 4b pilus protein PilO2 [Pseudomonadota bacterium]|nr:type 4b pilus protein PilO2 [Pseudomonadota bacterium]